MKGRSKPPVNLFKWSPPLKRYPDQSDNPMKEGTVHDILQQILEPFPAQLLRYHWLPPPPFTRMMSELLLWLLMETAVHLWVSARKRCGSGRQGDHCVLCQASALGNLSKGISVVSMLTPLGTAGIWRTSIYKRSFLSWKLLDFKIPPIFWNAFRGKTVWEYWWLWF